MNQLIRLLIQLINSQYKLIVFFAIIGGVFMEIGSAKYY